MGASQVDPARRSSPSQPLSSLPGDGVRVRHRVAVRCVPRGGTRRGRVRLCQRGTIRGTALLRGGGRGGVVWVRLNGKEPASSWAHTNGNAPAPPRRRSVEGVGGSWTLGTDASAPLRRPASRWPPRRRCALAATLGFVVSHAGGGWAAGPFLGAFQLSPAPPIATHHPPTRCAFPRPSGRLSAPGAWCSERHP